MKILLVVPTLPGRGGAERAVSRLSTWMSRTHEVTVAAFETAHPAYDFGGEIVRLGFPSRPKYWQKMVNGVGRVWALSRLLRRKRPDRVLAFMESANFPTILAALMLGRLDRVSVSVRDNPAKFPDAYQRLIRVLYPRAGRVVAVSEGIRQALIHDFGMAPDRCVTIPNRVDIERIDQAIAHPHDFRRPAPRYVVAAGRLVKQKGFDLAIEAYRRLPETAPPLFIYGEGPDRAALEAQIQASGLTGRVLLPGAVKHLYPYLANAECFVLSSRHEGWPNVLMEAMACACPVVAFDCDYGPSEIVVPGESGMLVPAGDVSALSEALTRVLADPALRERLAAGARARIEAQSVEKILDAWLA